ncbi:hypothetical protein CCZ01_04180 [Helicobacter monodelphidis]|uniref:methyltransferase family protein n=1 Tax=Helicobacter sp. 15-1451 TaxID=2004995 RepID=UPI000DCE68AE|nr:isoprenylcysteine carboxylmethyltransferase family protein [Helicobacter sp. 15-1451]RAX58015.1 hypothetical protein CCZ01_04180 [Helicobacter sp. 15-1451]
MEKPFKRFPYTYAVGAILFIWTLVSYTAHSDTVALVIRATGIILIILGVLGRVYSTIFIGGMKNEGSDGKSFIDYGPYSITRNPLYYFSFVGFCGLLAIKAQVIFLVVGAVIYLLVYRATITSEEEFLRHKFGEPYEEYIKKVPRFFPRWCAFHTPDYIQIRPAFLHKEMLRSLNWVLLTLILLGIESLHYFDILPHFAYGF